MSARRLTTRHFASVAAGRVKGRRSATVSIAVNADLVGFGQNTDSGIEDREPHSMRRGEIY